MGIMALPARGEEVDAVLGQVDEAERHGFASLWMAHTVGVDALTMLALAGQRTERIELGSFVTPTHPRHPAALAQQALTTQAACGGRLVLGIGLSHRVVMEQCLGFDWNHPIRHMREYLTVLAQLLEQREFGFEGAEFTVRGYQLAISDAPPPSIVVAALGPQMLRLTGSLAAGTALWMGGPRYIRERAGPLLAESAIAAQRPKPRIIAGLPVCVTNDVVGVRTAAAQIYAVYGRLPSYRAILDCEGVAGPEDVALFGDASEVRAGLQALADAGVTDFAAALFTSSDRERAMTIETLRAFAAAECPRSVSLLEGDEQA